MWTWGVPRKDGGGNREVQEADSMPPYRAKAETLGRHDCGVDDSDCERGRATWYGLGYEVCLPNHASGAGGGSHHHVPIVVGAVACWIVSGMLW